MFNWYENNYEDRFYELEKDAETFAEDLREKYEFLHNVKDKDQRAHVEKKIDELISNFRYKITSLGDDVESDFGEKNDYIDELEGKIEEQETPTNWLDWIDFCLKNLPGNVSVGDYEKAKEFLEKYIR